MASPPPPPPPPVGEDSWLDFIDQQRRTANSIEQRIHAVELYRSAVNAEPGSIRIWITYCDYFWSLYLESAQRSGAVAFWPLDEQAAAADFFSLDAALHLWSEGHEATKYRLSDSHELWNRWIALERELLDRTRTTEGVRRITHLYRNRLTIPHATWDDTSSTFSSFLSEFNPAAYEETMRAVTEQSRIAKYIIEQRDPMEMVLRAAVRSGDESAHRDTMARYLAWEVANVQATEHNDKPTALRVALGLFSRALTGIFRTDDAAWSDLIVFISQLRNDIGDGSAKNEELAHILPNSLDVLQRAVQHCPWSGALWARYIISGEQSSLSFSDMERIKHAATNSSLDRDGMAAVVDMYATWCGYLRRCAMDPNASDESVDLADSGLVAALEAVQVWGERRFGSAFQGDPNFRLERIMIYHLTEKHGAIDEAREHWEKLARKELLAHDYSFWLSYYMWEMNLLQSQKGTGRSPTPAPAARLSRTPSRPASILQRALQTPQLNWPERVIEIYVKHCNDFESSDVLQNALDEVHNLQRVIAQQRRDATAIQAAQAEAHTRTYESQALETTAAATESRTLGLQQTGDSQDDLNAGVKRKWEANASGEAPESATKKSKNEDNGAKAVPQSHEQNVQEQQPPKRDRENTSVFVSNLPSDATITKVRQYFREYGHVNNIQLKQEENGKSTVALVEFRSVEDVQSALIRDGKYFGDHTISVKEAAGITLYVTNFPPSTDDDSLHRLFGKSSNIFGIRWPSLKYNAHRRFCYVSFRDPESALKATGLNGKMLDGKYRLSVQYSDPAAKKAREGATDEGREVHIKNIPQEFDEQAIEQLVAKYGTVKRVRLLHNMAGRSRGTAFVDLETKDEAERVVTELDKVKLGTQILKVELSVSAKFKPSARETSAVAESVPPVNGTGSGGPDESKGEAGHEARGNLHLRSFALLGIPDTVNITRVRSLAEPHGHITKLKLYPEHGGAIIEFEDETTAGKAQLALDGTQLEGHTLRVGAVPQLFKEKSGVRIDRVDVAKPRPPKPISDTTNATVTKKTAATTGPVLLPAFVRRPVLSGKGAKHGLGFSAISATTATKKDDQSAATNGAAMPGTGTGSAPPKKSNSDFRALFLAGKSSVGSKEKDNEVESKASMAATSVDNSDTKPDDTKMEIDVVVNGH
ncbi:u4 u6 snrna-associated-splicing factor prp24 [Ophiostoma piceae UAMH 11346]|uniref:U4/U6 snRNA-associated-splicing factor PRP24 n=1 Tax=Ophiostoma piceae (strain UAMH 11346) TaxID=1262450 RepID=S3C076_OPHP1|nr:u4 u6 snrna-associated-splicing factor prp24 [Ophiostoma piceae UAMH 11346]